MGNRSRPRMPIRDSWTTTADRGPRTGRSTSRQGGTSLKTTFRRLCLISSNKETVMKTQTIRMLMVAAPLAIVLAATTLSAHHSFAMYDQTKTVTLTGVVKQFVAQANHAELHFYLVAPDRKGYSKGAD